jgi:ATP-dependent DNA helicase RecG
MNESELLALLSDLESDRVERKASLANPNRIREAICAFANDLPGYQKPGVIFIGINDDGTCSNLEITDKILLNLADMRDDGLIQPLPSMEVQKQNLAGCEMAVVVVHPSMAPPVRFNGRTWIRVGPRRSKATLEEERRLIERRRTLDLPFDLHPLNSSGLNQPLLPGWKFHRLWPGHNCG